MIDWFCSPQWWSVVPPHTNCQEKLLFRQDARSCPISPNGFLSKMLEYPTNPIPNKLLFVCENFLFLGNGQLVGNPWNQQALRLFHPSLTTRFLFSATAIWNCSPKYSASRGRGKHCSSMGSHFLERLWGNWKRHFNLQHPILQTGGPGRTEVSSSRSVGHSCLDCIRLPPGHDDLSLEWHSLS